MSKAYLKLLIWAVLSVCLGFAGWTALSGAAALLVYFEKGANPAEALHIVPNIPPDLHVDVSWRPDAVDPGRAMESLTRRQLTSSYVRAWLQIQFSYLRHEPYGLKTYFSGPALDGLQTNLSEASSEGVRVAQVDTRHDLELEFYSADGSVVAVTDHGAEVSRIVTNAEGRVLFSGEIRADYHVVLFLEDGNWRVRHWVIDSPRDTAADPAPSSPLRAELVGRVGKQLVLSGRAFFVAGVDYHPQEAPWRSFWSNYDPKPVDRDLSLAASLGLNTVRVYVPFQEFGGAWVGASMLDHLDDLLDRAANHDVKVILVLFDGRADHTLQLWPEADRHLQMLLEHLRDHASILAWDLRGAPSLASKEAERAADTAWLVHVARLARIYDPNHLLTIGWRTPEDSALLADIVDFVSFDDFGAARGLADRYRAIRAAVPDKPIVLGSFGLSTWNGVWLPMGHTEDDQASHYADVLRTLRASDAAGSLAWTLHDLSYTPASLDVRTPWHKASARHMGIVRADGTLKPAAALLRPFARLDGVGASRWSSIGRWSALTLVFLSVLVGWMLARAPGWRAATGATWRARLAKLLSKK